MGRSCAPAHLAPHVYGKSPRGHPRPAWDDRIAAFHDHGILPDDRWQEVRQKMPGRDCRHRVRARLLELRAPFASGGTSSGSAVSAPGCRPPTSHTPATFALNATRYPPQRRRAPTGARSCPGGRLCLARPTRGPSQLHGRGGFAPAHRRPTGPLTRPCGPHGRRPPVDPRAPAGPQDRRAPVPHTTTCKNDAAKITVTRHLPHTTQVYQLTAPNVLVTHRRYDERYTIQAEGATATTLYTWTTRPDLPHPTLHHAPSWPKPFHTADRPNKKPKHTGVHTPAQEAQHRHEARRKAHTLHDDHTIPRISAPPARVSDANHNRTITGIFCITAE